MAYQIYYWTACKSFWGRAIGVILTLDEAGVEYTIHPPEEVPVPQRFTFPVLTLAKGLSMGQVPAILNVLGQRFGLAGTTDAERIASQEAVLDVDDVFAEAQGGKFTKDPDRAAKRSRCSMPGSPPVPGDGLTDGRRLPRRSRHGVGAQKLPEGCL